MLTLALDAAARVLAAGGDAHVVQLWLLDGGRPAGEGEADVTFSCKTVVHSLALSAAAARATAT